jgi:hypothetical protein
MLRVQYTQIGVIMADARAEACTQVPWSLPGKLYFWDIWPHYSPVHCQVVAAWRQRKAGFSSRCSCLRASLSLPVLSLLRRPELVTACASVSRCRTRCPGWPLLLRVRLPPGRTASASKHRPHPWPLRSEQGAKSCGSDGCSDEYDADHPQIWRSIVSPQHAPEHQEHPCQPGTGRIQIRTTK